MWKTTDRYVQQKRVKAVEAESKLKQVYIPNYTKTNSAINNSSPKSMVAAAGGVSVSATGMSGNMNGTANGNGNNDIITINGGKPCESCSGVASYQVNTRIQLPHLVSFLKCLMILTRSCLQWYSWGPTHLNCRLCHICWTYWKKYGGLKVASRLADSELEMLKKKVNSEVEDGLNDLSNRPPHRYV